MAEVTDKRVLRCIEGGPSPLCPVCGAEVSGWMAEPELIWVQKPEYRGIPGLPVGPEFGEQKSVGQHLRVEPCGHEIDSIEATRLPKPPSPLSRFKVADDYNGDKDLEHDCGWQTGWTWREHVSLQTIVDVAMEHAKNCGEATVE